MSSPLLTPARVLGLTALLLLVNSQLTVRYGGKAGALLRPVADTFTLPVRAPIYAAARRLSRPEGDSSSAPTSQLDRATPAQLRRAYQQMLVQQAALRQEIEDLTGQLEFLQGYKARTGLSMPFRVPAKIAGYTEAGARQVLTINRGSKQGVASGQTVLYQTQLVGRVVGPIGPLSADIELITGQDIGFHVEVTPPPDPTNPDTAVPFPGLERLRVNPAPDEHGFTAEVRHDVAPPVGAWVQLADEIHYRDARGILLGYVEEVRPYPADPQLLKQIVIRPTFDLRSLSEVLVLVPDPSEKK